MKEDIKNILMITPSPIIAEGVKSILSGSEFSVQTVLPDVSKSSIERLASSNPAIVILDPTVLDYPSRNTAVESLRAYFQGPFVAIIHAVYDDDILKQFSGTVNLYDSPASILKKLRKAEAEEAGGDISEPSNELSSREKEILICVAEGMLNKEIAYKYGISIYTVMTHRKNITRKTGIKSVAGLTAYALLNGLTDLSSIK